MNNIYKRLCIRFFNETFSKNVQLINKFYSNVIKELDPAIKKPKKCCQVYLSIYTCSLIKTKN